MPVLILLTEEDRGQIHADFFSWRSNACIPGGLVLQHVAMCCEVIPSLCKSNIFCSLPTKAVVGQTVMIGDKLLLRPDPYPIIANNHAIK